LYFGLSLAQLHRPCYSKEKAAQVIKATLPSLEGYFQAAELIF